MSKILISLMAFFAIMGTISCSQQDMPEQQSAVSLETTPLIQELKAYNQGLPNLHESRLSFLGWVGVAAADAVGAYHGASIGGKVGAFFGPQGAAIGTAVGGVVVGVGASYHSYKFLNTPSRDFQEEIFNQLRNNICCAYAQLKEVAIERNDSLVFSYSASFDSVAVMVASRHNQALDTIQSPHFRYSADAIKLLPPQEAAIMQDSALINVFNDIVPIANDYSLIPAQGETDEVMNCFLAAIQRSAVMPADITQIANDYIEIIERRASLTLEQREVLYTAFTVAAYSLSYWKDYENENENENENRE